MKKKLLLLFGVALLLLVPAVSPVLAIGPEKGKGNPNTIVQTVDNGDGTFNVVTEVWLPSGVMNEWINTGYPHSAGHAHVVDASKAQIKNAIIASDPFDVIIYAIVFGQENVWFYYTQQQFHDLLFGFGLDTSRTDAFTDGIFIRMTLVGWSGST